MVDFGIEPSKDWIADRTREVIEGSEEMGGPTFEEYERTGKHLDNLQRSIEYYERRAREELRKLAHAEEQFEIYQNLIEWQGKKLYDAGEFDGMVTYNESPPETVGGA